MKTILTVEFPGGDYDEEGRLVTHAHILVRSPEELTFLYSRLAGEFGTEAMAEQATVAEVPDDWDCEGEVPALAETARRRCYRGPLERRSLATQ